MFAHFIAFVALGFYEDPLGRFALDVPQGYELQPRFGDREGVRFIKPADRRLGIKEVIFELRLGVLTARCTQGRVKAISGSSWHVLSKSDTSRYSRTIQDRCVVVQITAGRREQRRERLNFHLMLSSIRIKEPPELISKEASSTPRLSSLRMIGVWLGPRKSLLHLRKDGHFELGQAKGSWRVDNEGQLELRVQDRSPRRLKVSFVKDNLILSGKGLPPTRYTRSPSYAKEQARPASSLIGTWSSGRVKLQLKRGGRFRLAQWEGSWEAAEQHLLLKRGPTEMITYTWVLQGSDLILSGADLDVPLSLKRGVDVSSQRQ